MKVLDPGYKYEIANLEGGTQQIRFIKKESDDDGNFKTVVDGTTNEELLKVLIDRLEVQNKKMPLLDNERVLLKLESALDILNERVRDRKARGVIDTTTK